jgi:hypothetical protein
MLIAVDDAAAGRGTKTGMIVQPAVSMKPEQPGFIFGKIFIPRVDRIRTIR